MPIIAIGTPRILTERINIKDGGGFHQQTNFNSNHEINNVEKDSDFDSKNTSFSSSQNSDPSIIIIRRNINYFVTITCCSIALWSIKPEILLSKVVRDNSSLSQDGQNVDVIWNPYGIAVAVLTSHGAIHFYQVTRAPLPSFGFGREYQFSEGPGEGVAGGDGLNGGWISFRMALEVDSGAQCALGIADELLVCTSNPPSLLSFSWSGAIHKKATALLSSLDFVLDGNDAITQLVMTPDQGIFGWVTVDGKAYIARRILDSDPTHSAHWNGTCIYTAGPNFAPATTIDFNPSFSLLAVGNLQGVVNVFDLDALKMTASFSYSLAITKPGTKSQPIKLGAVSGLSWSGDGLTLAVGWVYGGVSVWSVYGCLLTSTVSEDTFVHASDGVVVDTTESFFTGVQSLFWGEGDYFLFVLPAPYKGREIVLDIFILEFGKSSILTSISNQHNSSVCIIASDRLLVYDGIKSDNLMMGLDPLNWNALHIPSVYISTNWPIKYASFTSNGQYLAISGRRGFAHYNFASERWKFFGNEIQEQGFAVTGLLWYRTLIILSCKNIKTEGYEIRVYSRETKLDDANILHVETFDSEIAAMNLTDLHLLVFSKNCVMQSFIVYISDGPSLVFHLRQAFSLEDFVGQDRECIQGVVRLRPPDQKSMNDLFNSSILLLKNGSLFLIWKQSKGWLASKMADKVEHFWVSRTKSHSEFQSSIWIFDGKGAKILSNPSNYTRRLATASSGAMIPKEGVFNMALDFYPFIVLPEQGILVGIKQQLSLNKALEISQFGTELKSYLFVHLIIQQYLSRGETARALEFARTFESLGYFNHALEMMLHSCLEHDSEKDITSADLMLPAAIEFVNLFPRSLEIIVNCARKSEMALWSYFFSIAGDPKLFGAFNVATSYLIIIQTLEPVHVSGLLALKLLEHSLDAGDYDTGSELYRFLRSIYDAETESVSRFNSTTDLYAAPPRLLTEEERANMLFFEQLIQKKAKTLLGTHRFREFLKFSSVFAIAVAGFLRQENDEFEKGLGDFGACLEELHEQFTWPFLDALPTMAMKRKNSTNEEKGGWSRRTSLFMHVVTHQKKIVSKREQELRLFLSACMLGNTPSMALLLSAMLLDLETVTAILRDNPQLYPRFVAGLEATRKAVYAQVIDVVGGMRSKEIE